MLARSALGRCSRRGAARVGTSATPWVQAGAWPSMAPARQSAVRDFTCRAMQQRIAQTALGRLVAAAAPIHRTLLHLQPQWVAPNNFGVRSFSSSPDDTDPTASVSAAAGPIPTPEPVEVDAMPISWEELDSVLDSIVKVYATVSPPNYILPWQNKPLKEVTGSGFAVSVEHIERLRQRRTAPGGAVQRVAPSQQEPSDPHEHKRIITNAHVVADQKYTMVRKGGSPIRYDAQVEAVGHECDLTLLKVTDSSFWQDLPPLELSQVPALQDEVLVVGYPVGGDNVSVTKGVVSRVEPQQYAHGATKLLAIQIDAAVNPGNSGGPALTPDTGKVVGVAFQNMSNAENIGFIIPIPIVEHFLLDSLPGPYRGFCSLGVHVQALENTYFQSVLRKGLSSVRQSDNEPLEGVLVNEVYPVSPAAGVLKPRDVIVSVDGYPVARDGTVLFRGRERLSFDYVLSQRFAGDTCTLGVWRDGKPKELSVTLAPVKHLVPAFQFDQIPSYMIYAGLVFVPLTQPYLHEWGYEWYNQCPRRLCDLSMTAVRKFPDEEVVILSNVLLDEINVGYQWMTNLRVHRVNGKRIRNLKHMKAMLQHVTCQAEGKPTPQHVTELLERVEKEHAAFARSEETNALESERAQPEEEIEYNPHVVVMELDEHRLLAVDPLKALQKHGDILAKHNIPAAHSKDLADE